MILFILLFSPVFPNWVPTAPFGAVRGRFQGGGVCGAICEDVCVYILFFCPRITHV